MSQTWTLLLEKHPIDRNSKFIDKPIPSDCWQTNRRLLWKLVCFWCCWCEWRVNLYYQHVINTIDYSRDHLSVMGTHSNDSDNCHCSPSETDIRVFSIANQFRWSALTHPSILWHFNGIFMNSRQMIICSAGCDSFDRTCGRLSENQFAVISSNRQTETNPSSTFTCIFAAFQLNLARI